MKTLRENKPKITCTLEHLTCCTIKLLAAIGHVHQILELQIFKNYFHAIRIQVGIFFCSKYTFCIFQVIESIFIIHIIFAWHCIEFSAFTFDSILLFFCMVVLTGIFRAWRVFLGQQTHKPIRVIRRQHNHQPYLVHTLPTQCILKYFFHIQTHNLSLSLSISADVYT